MLRVLGGPKRFCDGLTRRELLQVGSLGFLGSVLPRVEASSELPVAAASSALPGFGRAKSCILLFMYGSPSQLETFDPKPDAPVEVRGELGCIPSCVPGLDKWSRCYSVVMAGGGVKRGCVLGKSDKIASDPLERRVSPKDVLATIYHLLGIDPATTLTDQQGRPMALAPEAEVIAEILA
jgi:Protein of unknown function (DUF1501)